MGTTTLGRTLLIANPVSRSGLGAKAATTVYEALSQLPESVCAPELQLTTGPGDAAVKAKGSAGFDTILAIGGDGLIHETVCGLVELAQDARPVLGIVPMGSGNDYARTLHMKANDPGRAVKQLLSSHRTKADIGLVNGIPYIQTLSFGLDAAIALDTMNHRSDGRGAKLYADSGFRILSSAKDGFAFTGTIDGRPVQGREAVFAVQVGPTYGGGFRVCPAARIDDGLLDVCYSETLPPLALTLGLFCLARFGLHTRSKHLHLVQAHHVVLDFPEPPPCQADGERIVATHFEIESVPHALDILVP